MARPGTMRGAATHAPVPLANAPVLFPRAPQVVGRAPFRRLEVVPSHSHPVHKYRLLPLQIPVGMKPLHKAGHVAAQLAGAGLGACTQYPVAVGLLTKQHLLDEKSCSFA